MSFAYAFNNGQVVPGAAYFGTHMDNLMATMKVDEMANGMAKITVTLENTVDGAMYMVHAHDAADPATTPNGTPYNEAPNGDVFSQMATGNGSTVMVEQNTTMSYSAIIEDYAGFFVVHDPLQSISTTDISTYLVVGTFARMQQTVNLSRSTFNYAFNSGQLEPTFAYSGSHPMSLSAMVTVQELADGTSRVGAGLMNSMANEMYMVHSHDMADPATTPNGTPYNETPNGDVLNVMLNGNGGTVYRSQISPKSYTELTSSYDGFFVVHDPLQPISTVDPTTYVILGVFAR